MNCKVIHSTPYGNSVILWTAADGNPVITRVLLSNTGYSATDQLNVHFPESIKTSCSFIDDVASRMIGFLEGAPVSFTLDLVKMSLCAKFQQSVLRAEHQIPRSSISTYRLIAGYLGDPNKARAVGNALANNPFPIIIPCHRAIRSDGQTGGYQGGSQMKRKLLEIEGIKFDKNGCVSGAMVHFATATPTQNF